MADQSHDPVRSFVADRIARYEPIVVHAPDRRGRLRARTSWRKVKSGWTPIDALDWARDRDVVTVFREAAMLVMLCGDAKARAMPEHQVIHACLGLTACVGPALLVRTARSLGISDERATFLVEQLRAEARAAEGLLGAGNERTDD